MENDNLGRNYFITKYFHNWVAKSGVYYTTYTMFYFQSGLNYRSLLVVTEPEACLAYLMQYLRTQITVPKQREEISSVISHFDARCLVLDLSGIKILPLIDLMCNYVKKTK